MTEPDTEPTLFSVSPEHAQVDGHDDVEADLREEGRHRIRVLNSVRDYMGRKKRKRK